MASEESLRHSGQSPAGVKNRSVSPSPHPHAHPLPQYNDPGVDLTLDPATSFSTSSFSNNPTTDPDSFAYTTASYLASVSATLAPSNQAFAPSSLHIPQTFDLDPSSLSLQTSQQQQQQQKQQQHHHHQVSEETFSSLLNNNQGDFDFSSPLYQHPSPHTTVSDYDSPLLLDPNQSRPVSQAVNPADLVTHMPSPHPSTSPQMTPLEQPQHSSPGPMSPPSSTPGAYYTPQHSRHTSLDPATAALMTSNPDWQTVMANSSFQGHRRAPSEVSDISSAAHSPYISQHESFEPVDNNRSPLLAPQNDHSLFDNAAMGIESFTLSDPQQQGISPAHSPYISPQLMPQHPTEMIPNVPYISTPATSSPYPAQSTEAFVNGTDGLMPQGNVSPGDMGQASQMAPPSINVELAPSVKTHNFPLGKSDMPNFDALSPPALRGPSRLRSKSDPYARQVTRARSPSSPSSSLEPLAPSTPRSLSPYSNPSSREPSPNRSSRRVSMSSVGDRNYILGLADPQRPGANAGDSKRVQKHPATFQCTLCPKRFTRAYNLRSHLRTHTDERPFVCTVCGKAFARQHDRKRHEGLHSGEKKFVCRGELTHGGHWGCNRRFARADALGRHFRSEAGRICIKPLLDEESQERERSMMDQQQHHLQPYPQPLMVPGMDGQQTGNFILPAALLAQYPALQNLQWDQIPAGPDDPNDMSGRNSFDASSGGEFGYDDDESGISVSGMSAGYASDQGNMYGINSHGQMMGLNPDQQDWRD